jgi:5S rRNA maturation endonuclease (ribonuclease M5)
MSSNTTFEPTTIEKLLPLLQNIKTAGKDRWVACCPGHADTNPSLSISKGERGILLKCFAGCSLEAVCKKLGITTSSLFYDSGKPARRPPERRREPEATPVSSGGSKGREVAVYDYLDEDGELLFQKVRYEPKDFMQRRPDGKGGWLWSLNGTRRVLYRLPALLQKPLDEIVFIVEGEKDVHTLESIGLTATTNGAAGKWLGQCKDPSFQKPLKDRRIAILGDNDEAGQKNVRQIAESLFGVAKEVRIVKVPDGFKDITEYLESRDSVEPDDLRELILSWHSKAAIFDPHKKGELVFISMADIQAEPVKWLWPNRIPANMFSMLVGNPGQGKSFILMYLAAVVSTGRDWPDCKNDIPAGTVLLINGEESAKHAIKPRLEWNCADCSKVHIVHHIAAENSEEAFDITKHITELHGYLDRVTDCRAIIIDPITAFLGKVNENNNAEVRAALLPLITMAEERQVTIIGLSHMNKKSDLQAIHRTLGSTAFTAAPRSVWLVEAEPMEKDENGQEIEGPRWRKFLPVKYNLSIDPSGLRFLIVGKGQVQFDSTPYRQTADDAVSQQSRMEARAMNDAMNFLREQLSDGQDKAATEIEEAAQAEGIAGRTLQRAKKALGVRSVKSKLDGWRWTL